MRHSRHDRRRPGWTAVAVLIATALTTIGVGSGVADAAPEAPTAVGAVEQTAAPAWDPGAPYNQGDVVSHNGRLWQANHFMWPGVEPSVAGAPPFWVPWQDLGPAGGGGGDPVDAVEQVFQATGPWQVTRQTVEVPGATTGPIILTYPTNLGADGVDHPILTYALGTQIGGPDPGAGQGVFDHLASWGFVVAGIGSPGLSGEGQEADSMRAAADYLVGQNADSASVFFEKLDTKNVGVFGHSQGAAATILTVGTSRNADRLFSSAVPLDLPNRTWWAPDTNPNYNLITEPIFFVSGNDSVFIADQSEQTFFFDQVPAPAAKAAAVGKDHTTMIDASLGYTTAWFKYTLEGDGFARQAFVATDGNPPEISVNPNWTNRASKNLP